MKCPKCGHVYRSVQPRCPWCRNPLRLTATLNARKRRKGVRKYCPECGRKFGGGRIDYNREAYCPTCDARFERPKVLSSLRRMESVVKNRRMLGQRKW